MQCPNCELELVIADRHGVEIDYCPKCRGVWLDRGELDKIVEISKVLVAAGPNMAESRDARKNRDDDDDDDDGFGGFGRGRKEDDDDKPGGPQRKKRSGFLGELFDLG